MLDWLSVVLTFVGSVLIARHNIRGFYFFLTANVTWIAWCLSQNPIPWSIVAMNAAYLGINSYGIARWRARFKPD